jgi:hypothetical protein
MLAPSKARNDGIESNLMKFVIDTQWVGATAQVPPNQRLASRSGANPTCSASHEGAERGGALIEVAMPRPYGATVDDLGAVLLSDIGHGDGVFMDIETNIQCTRLVHS